MQYKEDLKNGEFARASWPHFAAYLDSTEQELVAEALEIDPDNAFAKSMQVKLDQGKNLTGKELNKLIQQNEAAMKTVAKTSDQAGAVMDNAQTTEENAPETVRNDRRGAARAVSPELEAASRKYGAQAQVMVDAYEDGQNVEQFDQAYELAYDLGKEGVAMEFAMESEALSYLTESQRSAAYTAGVAAAENTSMVQGVVKELGITGNAAQVLAQSFNANQITAKDYAMGLQEVYEAGKAGIPMKEAGSHAAKLTDAQRQIAYKQGQKAGGRQVAKQQAQVRKNRTDKGADTSKGKVHFEGDRTKLNAAQKAGLDAMDMLSKALGVQFYVFESKVDENGNHVGANGWYDPSDGSIHIDLYAGNNGKGTMLFTVAHELTHFIRQWSPAKFRVLANFLTKQYTAQGQSIDDLVVAQQEKAARAGRELDPDTAYEEMVADSMETMLSDGSIIEMMADLKQQDHGLWQKICDWFKDLAGKIQAVVDAYKGVQPDSTEGRMVADMKDIIGTLEALYMDALVDASENFDAGVQKITTEDSGGVKYSIRKDIVDSNGVHYDSVVELEYGLFKKIARSGNAFISFIRNSLISQKLVVTDGNGTSEVVEFAKMNDRAQKDGASSPKRVLGKLERAVGSTKKLVIVNAKETTEISTLAQHKVDNSHQWLDANGWDERKSFVMTNENMVYPVILHIAKARDGRNILYDVSVMISEGVAVDQGATSQRAKTQIEQAVKSTTPSDKENIPHSALTVKTDELSKVIAERQTAEERYNTLVNDPALVAAERRLEEMRNGGESRFAVVRSPEYKAARAERDAIKERLGVDAARDSAFDLREQERKLQAEIQAEEETAKAEAGRKAELEAVKKSGMSEADYFRDRAAKRFGYTQEFQYAGYLLPDGKLLDFTSEEGKRDGKRDKDHREIGDIYEYTHQSAALLRFLNDGNIRIMAETPGIDLTANHEPTSQQYAEIKRFVREYANKRQFMVDLSGADGRIVGTYTYDGRISADRVISDIQYYFQNGKLREQSPVAGFHYSMRNGNRQAVAQALEKENAKLREDVAELRELVSLQRQVTNGTKFTKTSVEAAARYLKQNANSKGSTQELSKLLNGLYEYIASTKELTWEGVKEQAQGAVDWLWEHIDRKGKRSDYAQEILTQLHGTRVRLDESQMAEAQYRFGSYNEFRKRLMGSITLAKDANTSLDSLWAEFSQLYPDVFDGEITAADMPGALADVIERLRTPEATALEYARDRELMEQDLLREIYDSYWRVSTLYTPADVGARRINKLKLEHYQRMDKLKQQHRETVDQLKQEHRARLEQVRKEHRAKLEEKTEQITKKYQDARKKNVEGRRKTEMRGKIRKVIRDLNKLLTHGTKERNVKEGMKDLVANTIASAEVLFIDTYTTEDMIRNGVGVELTDEESKLLNRCMDILSQLDNAPAVVDEQGMSDWYQAERKLRDRLSGLEKQLEGVFQRERKRLDGMTVSSILGSLSDAYAKLKDAEEDYLRDAYDENVFEHLQNIREGFGVTRAVDMRLDQLEALHKAYTMVLTTVRNANKSFAENLKGSRKELAQAVTGELAQAGKVRGKQTAAQIKRARRSWNNEKPVYAFERLGSETMKTLYNNLRDGEDVWMVDVDEARDFYLKAAKDHGFNGWDFKQRHSFMSSTGLEFDLDLQQIMSIYAYSRREQALDHLMKGGFVFDKNTEMVVNEGGIRKTYIVDDATAYNLSMETFHEIISKLTPQQKAFVDTMQGYLSDTMGGKGNEVSMKLYGVKLFHEKFYFPLRSSGAYLDKAKVQELQKQQGSVSIKNSGFTNATTPKASNPVVLSGFMDVWANHVNDMSMYHAFVLPLEDFNKVYRYSTPHIEGEQSASVNQAIINAHGSAATDYIDQFIRDLNGGVVADPREGDYKAWISKFKKASVMASASVVVQQPSAIVRALAYIDPKYFGAFTISRGIGRALGNKVTHNHTKLYDELKKYAPVAGVKQMGYFDTNIGMTAVEYLTVKEFGSFREAVKGFFTDKNYRKKRMDDWMGFMAARADEITWAQIWQAVKKEVADKQGLKAGSEAHLQAAGKRFTEVISKTQVYDSVFSRSANMRSKGALMSMATSFMAEPTTTANMLTDAIRKGRKGDVKFFLRVGASVAGAIIFNNILRSAVYAMRDDDEDETFVEKYLQALAGGMLDDVNPMSYLPFWRDVWSLAQGYDVERADMSVIATAIDAATGLGKVLAEDTSDMSEEQKKAHSEKLAAAGWKLVDGLASLVGLPEKNLRRDIVGTANLFETLAKDADRKITAGSLKDNVWEDFVSSVPGVNIVVDTDSRADDLYDAIVSGDSAYVERLKAGYSSADAYTQAVRKGLRENDGRIKAAAVARVEGDLEGYMTIAREIIGEGNFVQDDVVAAINAEINALMKEPESSAAAKVKGLFDANAFATAISQGDARMAKIIRDDLIQTAQRNGKTKEEAEKSFVSTATSACKDMFCEGDLSESQAVDALVKFCGKDKVEAAAKVSYWDFEQEHPDVEASAQWFETYYKKVEDSGISVEDYVEYRIRKSGYTKRADILEVIDGMDLTAKQKDALYRAEGYAESTLDEAPWH